MFYIVYKTTNLLNGKYYIGAHKCADLDDGYLGSGRVLQRALKKYGKENFSREVLHYCADYDEMFLMEKHTVTKDIVADPTCYNLKIGGDGGFDYINTKVSHTKSRAGEANGMYGKTHTDEVKRTISEKKTGVKLGPQSEEHIERKRLSKCRWYKLIDPSGLEYLTKDLPTFCKDHNLNLRTMRWSIRSKKKPSSGNATGWLCWRLDS